MQLNSSYVITDPKGTILPDVGTLLLKKGKYVIKILNLKDFSKSLHYNPLAYVKTELDMVKFENMIYIADGPSDIPAFSLVHQNGGSTFAIYPKGDVAAMKQVEQMRADGRVDMYAEADYSENTTANMWITNRIQELADKIREREKNKIEKYAGGVPRHLV